MKPSILLWCPHCGGELAITDEGTGRCECGGWYFVVFDGDATDEGDPRDASRIKALDSPDWRDVQGDEIFHRNR